MNIVFIERIFPHYRKTVYDLIYKEKRFVFLHSVENNSGIKQTKAEYSSLIKSFRYGNKESQAFLFVLKKLLHEKPKIIIHEFSAGILSKPLLLLYCRLTRTKLIFWGHMYDRAKGFSPEKSWADRYRLWLWRKAHSLITYSQSEKQLLIDNKISADKIFVAFNTVDTISFLKVRNRLEEIDKHELKKHLQFTHQFNLTFIGRLYKEKKPELLLDLLAGLRKKGIQSVAIHYVGHGEMLPSLKEKSLRLGFADDVFFHGAIYDEITSGQILFCSDLMIIPGFVGLSVNHAFCFNCPVVTFKQIDLDPPHSPEVEYIIDRKTGFLVAEHSIEALTEVVASYLNSQELRKAMQAEVKNLIENVCSVERMAKGVINAINYNSN